MTSHRRSSLLCMAGYIAVTAGVILHVPMFVAARHMHYRLAGMPMGGGMLLGMTLIVAGLVIAAYGLLPRDLDAPRRVAIQVAAPEDLPLGRAHVMLMVVLVSALVIDVMKPASLGFVVPGMAQEYDRTKSVIALVPFAALIGTVMGSVVWGIAADTYGRKASIMLAALMFVGTSICGAMPSLAWNVGMCFLMGLAAGGMLPVTYALLAETMPTRHRGWSLVLVGGLGAGGGYLAASLTSALLQPIFGWRIVWLANLPSGIILLLLGRYIPESPKFLVAHGYEREARMVMQAFGAIFHDDAARMAPSLGLPSETNVSLVGRSVALGMAGLTWGCINFGLLLWLPGELIAKHYSVGIASRLLAESALIAFLTLGVAALLYSRWSTRSSLAAAIGVTLVGLLGVLAFERRLLSDPVFPVALLVVGSSGLIAILLPYAAECFPLRVRGRATGWVAASTKGGGVLMQALGISALVPPMSMVAVMAMIPAAAALILVLRLGPETRLIDLRTLDAA